MEPIPHSTQPQIEALIVNTLGYEPITKKELAGEVVGVHDFAVAREFDWHQTRRVTKGGYGNALHTLRKAEEIIVDEKYVKLNPDWDPGVGGTC